MKATRREAVWWIWYLPIAYWAAGSALVTVIILIATASCFCHAGLFYGTLISALATFALTVRALKCDTSPWMSCYG